MTTQSANLSDLDLFASGAPWQEFEKLRADAPLHWSEEDAPNHGFWSVTKYHDIVSVLRDPDTFTSERFTNLEEVDKEQEEARRSMLETDGTRHRAMRQLLQGQFTPSAVAQYETFLRGLTATTLDKAFALGEFDFVKEVAADFPINVIRAAPGSGLVTGFFLHRANPLQEIDIEFPGSDPRRMLANVYFNPGDDGAAMSFGYRGSPCWIDLGFDASADFHRYAIDWRPGRVAWLVDGRVVHERVGWDPTPIPHLAMRVHANVWAPRSEELAGRVDERRLPVSALFRSVSVRS